MKNLISTTALLLVVSGTWAQTNCTDLYEYFKKGFKLEYTSYDAKGNLESVLTQEVLDVSSRADTTVALVKYGTKDKKEKQVTEGNFPVKCHNGVLYFDMQSMVPQQQGNSAGGGEMAVEVRSTDMTFPADIQVGQKLEDSEMDLKMSMGTMTVLNTRYFIKNRKVEAREKVSTSAGAFDCVKISYDFEYNLLGQRTDHVEYWYDTAKGIMVKTVTYDRKGKEKSRMELTKL